MNSLDDYPVDIFGQLPALNLYTQIAICYPLPGTRTQSEITAVLSNGLERLYQAFPWLGGRVVCEGADDKSSGEYKVIALEPPQSLVVKDYTNDHNAPTYEELRLNGFPIEMLDESWVCPRSTLPGVDGKTYSNLPPLIVQATFVKGGLILAFLGQHQTMDGTGQGQVMEWFSKACKGEPFLEEELIQGNRSRRNLIPPLDVDIDPKEVLQRQLDSLASDSIAISENSKEKCSWVNIVFSGKSLAVMKALAAESITVDYITTDDVLTAFIYQKVTQVRRNRLEPTTQATLARAVNVRSYFDIPQTYPGTIQNMTYNTMTVEQLCTMTLGEVASEMRKRLDPKTSTLNRDTRALAQLYEQSPNKSIASVTANVNPSTDVTLSSWVKMNCYSMNFGLGLGKPEAVRRPQFTPVESLTYLLPKKEDGEVCVAICLNASDLELLKKDSEVQEYATF